MVGERLSRVARCLLFSCSWSFSFGYPTKLLAIKTIYCSGFVARLRDRFILAPAPPTAASAGLRWYHTKFCLLAIRVGSYLVRSN